MASEASRRFRTRSIPASPSSRGSPGAPRRGTAPERAWSARPSERFWNLALQDFDVELLRGFWFLATCWVKIRGQRSYNDHWIKGKVIGTHRVLHVFTIKCGGGLQVSCKPIKWNEDLVGFYHIKQEFGCVKARMSSRKTWFFVCLAVSKHGMPISKMCQNHWSPLWDVSS